MKRLWRDGRMDVASSRGRERERGREGGDKPWSRGLAELAVNLGRFIFSGARCGAR